MVKPCRNPSALLTRHSLSPIIKELRKKQQQLKQLKKIHKFYAKVSASDEFLKVFAENWMWIVDKLPQNLLCPE